MDKNTWIGFLLIAAIIVGFAMLSRPNKEQLAERQRINDSIRIAQEMEREAQMLSDSIQATITNAESAKADTISEDMLREQMVAVYGPFAPAAQGTDSEVILENNLLRLHIASKGGAISCAELKEYRAYGDSVNPLTLFKGSDETDLSFTLVTANNRILATRNLYFEAQQPNPQNVVMRLKTDVEDAYIDFIYTLPEDTYMFDFQIVPHNANLVLAQNMNSLEMQWNQRIPQQERGRKFEERYAHLQYMTTNLEQERMSEAKHDTKRESGKVRWIGYKDQFFSTVMIANDAFTSCEFESTPEGAHTRYIKEFNTKAGVGFDLTGQQPTSFRYFMGPNNYNLLKSYDHNAENEAIKLHLQEIVLQGWRIIIWINQIFSFPVFDWLLRFGLPIGWVILLMTLIIKLIILPFVFASYKSSAKMRVLKPQIDEINAKYPMDKMQERQQATMALYQRAGVSPMSGCLPMLFQMPILMAMFWFFPIAIELRGQSLWWAEDLSAYDAILTWGTSIPLLGDHLSLFCLIMTVANLGYTIITMQSQATDPNMKFMKWMMYLMPVMFLFIFNDYAAGLSFYYTISLGFTILQTMIFRWTTDDAKLLAQMEENAKKRAGKPKSRFMERLEQMQREQQRMARENAKAQQKKYR